MGAPDLPSSNGSLQRKLRRHMLLTTVIAVAVALVAMIVYDLHTYHRGWLEDLDAQAELLARSSGPALSFDDAKVAQENLALLRFQPKVRAAALYHAQGAPMAYYAVRGAAPAPTMQPQNYGTHIEDGEVIVLRRVIEHGQTVGAVYLRAEYELLARIANYSLIALFVSALAMLAAFLVSSRLQASITGPILAIGDVARDVVQHRRYGRRVEHTSDDEVGVVADAFNDMLDEIERRTQALEASHREKEREVEDRRHAQNEVMRLNDELEQRVLERTAQLAASNEELAEATSEAEKANRAKSEFLSSMSHELRTPLNAIIGFGQLLAADAAMPTRKREFAEHVVSAGQHLLTLINEILNLAQIESGRVSVSLEPVVLSEVLADCETITEELATRSHIRLQFPPPERLRVTADRTRLKQVLLNLLSNAIKYNRPRGAVAVTVDQREAGQVRISIHDTGHGLTEAQVASLFQPFNRLGQEAGPQEGTGIGLVVTQRLVRLMGGEIGVQSTPGSGSVFWVDLKQAVPDEALTQVLREKQAAAAVAEQPERVATVLCVEDNPASLELVQQVLQARPGLRVLSATDGLQGVKLARELRPDVILMDSNMPLMSGNAAQRVLREDPLTADIPVIALTANAMPDAVAEGLASGFYRYLTKPFQMQELIDAVDSALARRASTPPAP